MNVNVRPDEFTSEAEGPRSVTAPRILTPAIVILLGSTATISALELMRHMLTLKPEDRRRVALVYIDTDDWSTALVGFRQQYNGIFQEFPLRIAVPAGIDHITREYQKVSNPRPRKDKDEATLELHTFIEGHTPQYYANGAGGIRNNGHVAACFHHQDIYATLERALASVVRLDDQQGGKRFSDVQVNIVSFLGGGTGSGILPDITVMTREIIVNQQFQHRINLFCMLPEPVRGVSITDLSWRKSNATACLLELLAYSGAAGTAQGGSYIKYMRDNTYRLSKGAIANEVYLIGHASMDDATNTARIVGLDVFQRITDASGVGFLEHSKAVDRRTLGATDDRSLPTMFGTSCPLEVRFSADETAWAFARISAARLLPLLASYEPASPNVSDTDKRNWKREWDNVARINANPNDPKAIRPGLLKLEEFAGADQRRLDMAWSKLERLERDTEQRIRDVLSQKQREERRRISETPTPAVQDDNTSLLNLRIQYLQHLQQEYTYALELLAGSEKPIMSARPIDLEANLTFPGNWWFRVTNARRDFVYEVFEAYNNHLYMHAEATRYHLLEGLLEDLLQDVQEALGTVLSWFEDTRVGGQTPQDIEVDGLSSMAWQGHLENSHPHQRHIFDLRTLRSSDGRNIAVERLYVWATGGDKALNEGTPIDYRVYVGKCVDFITHNLNDPRGSKQDARLEDQSAGRLADRVVDFFHDTYTKKFQTMNLFELLDKAAPPIQKGQPRSKQISSYLLEHLQHIRGLMSTLVAFEAQLWSKGSTTLDTSIYLGIHWNDGYERGILDQALDNLGPVTTRSQGATIESDIDPHRLQVVYSQHAISLSTVRDFYLDKNSSMEEYLDHQKKWENSRGMLGLMPVHSSSEAQWLVREGNVLGSPTPLYQRVIRKPFEP